MSEDLEELNRQVASVPLEHRRVICRWLLGNARQYHASLVLTEPQARYIRDVLTGAAIELYEPLAENTTLLNAEEVIEELTSGPDPVG